MPTVYAITGIPASGKTTLAKKMQELNQNLFRTNRDDLRMQHHAGVYSSNNESLIKAMQEFAIVEALKAGQDVVCDDAGLLNPKTMQWLKTLAENNGADFAIDDACTHTPIDEAIRRNALRPNGVPEAVIWQFVDRYMPIAPREQYGNLPKAIVVDIDGCLARKHPDRDVYDWSKAHLDTVHDPIKHLVNNTPHEVIILTGRTGDQDGRKILKSWLLDNVVKFDRIKMRSKGDFSQAAVFKKRVLEELLQDWNIQLVLDDDATVIQMAKLMGLNTLQTSFLW
jgi:predicted kinase